MGMLSVEHSEFSLPQGDIPVADPTLSAGTSALKVRVYVYRFELTDLPDSGRFYKVICRLL
jgi:hypothetical protein